MRKCQTDVGTRHQAQPNGVNGYHTFRGEQKAPSLDTEGAEGVEDSGEWGGGFPLPAD